MIRQVEPFREHVELNAPVEVKRAIDTDVQTQEVASLAGVARNEHSIDDRPTGRALIVVTPDVMFSGSPNTPGASRSLENRGQY